MDPTFIVLPVRLAVLAWSVSKGIFQAGQNFSSTSHILNYKVVSGLEASAWTLWYPLLQKATAPHSMSHSISSPARPGPPCSLVFHFSDLRLNVAPLYESLGHAPRLFRCKCPHSFISSTGSEWADNRETERSQGIWEQELMAGWDMGMGRRAGESKGLRWNQLCAVLSWDRLCDPMDWGSVHGLLQARILEWVAMPSSRESSQSRDWTQVSCIAGRFFTIWASWEALHD